MQYWNATCLDNERTNTGLSKIADESPDNRPKTRRLEGGGDFPLIFFFTRRLADALSPLKLFRLRRVPA